MLQARPPARPPPDLDFTTVRGGAYVRTVAPDWFASCCGEGLSEVITFPFVMRPARRRQPADPLQAPWDNRAPAAAAPPVDLPQSAPSTTGGHTFASIPVQSRPPQPPPIITIHDRNVDLDGEEAAPPRPHHFPPLILVSVSEYVRLVGLVVEQAADPPQVDNTSGAMDLGVRVAAAEADIMDSEVEIERCTRDLAVLHPPEITVPFEVYLPGYLRLVAERDAATFALADAVKYLATIMAGSGPPSPQPPPQPPSSSLPPPHTTRSMPLVRHPLAPATSTPNISTFRSPFTFNAGSILRSTRNAGLVTRFAAETPAQPADRVIPSNLPLCGPGDNIVIKDMDAYLDAGEFADRRQWLPMHVAVLF